MNIPSDVEIAWSAGLWEGEGNIGVARGATYKGRFEPRLQLPMTDLDVLQKFQSIWSTGNIVGPYQGRPNEKPYWRWSVHSWDEFIAIGGAMRPWWGQRRGARYDFILSQMPVRFRKPRSFRPCDHPVTASVAGYLKHRRRGERACAVCLESYRLYQRDYIPKWRAARAQKLADSSS